MVSRGEAYTVVVGMVPVLLLFNWELRMSSVSFLVPFILALSVFLSSAEEGSKRFSVPEEEQKHHPNYCPRFYCEKLGSLRFPFNNETNPECGFCTVVNCSEETPQIQLERGRRYFRVKNISQSDTIVIQDKQLQEDLKQGRCEFIDNLTSSRSFVSFKPAANLSLLTLFKCHRNHSINLSTDHAYTSCHDFTIHYNLPNHTLIPPPPPECSIIEYPVNLILGIGNLSSLLTSDITLEVSLLPPCYDCHLRGGRCQYDEMGKFQCANVTGAQRGDKKVLRIAGLSVCIGVLLVVAFFFFFFFWRNCRSIKQTKNHPKIEAFLRNHRSLAPKRYHYLDIKKITDSFKDKIGEGGYGGVYKGKLVDGQMVAVKVLNETKGDGEEFINEIASISRTSHVNIVNLLGFCFEGPKRALIYEFMPNGSLEMYICNGNPSQTICQLGWETLYKISVGVARGLEYLHRGCNTRILHFDIKPHNILLSEDFCPKISDFGLAKLCTRKDSIISMLGAKGTPGYIAPEVFSRTFGAVSHKSDVYSYGMMVLDMVGGRKDVDGGSSHNSEVYFPDFIYKSIEEDAGPMEIMNDERECMRKMITVGLWCIQTRPSDRPPMCQVLDMLEGSLQSLQIPPKPFLFSPPRSLLDSSSTTIS